MKHYAIFVLAAAMAVTHLMTPAQAGQPPPNLGYAMSGRVADMDKWFGRSGGLVGSERVAGLRSGDRKPIVITYDKSVEARTNMPIHQAESQPEHVLTTWDEGVAKRTDMTLAAEQHAGSENPYVPPRAVH